MTNERLKTLGDQLFTKIYDNEPETQVDGFLLVEDFHQTLLSLNHDLTPNDKEAIAKYVIVPARNEIVSIVNN